MYMKHENRFPFYRNLSENKNTKILENLKALHNGHNPSVSLHVELRLSKLGKMTHFNILQINTDLSRDRNLTGCEFSSPICHLPSGRYRSRNPLLRCCDPIRGRVRRGGTIRPPGALGLRSGWCLTWYPKTLCCFVC